MKNQTATSARRIAAGACFIHLLVAGISAGDATDNFNDNSKAASWGADEFTGNGRLTEGGQQLRYTCTSGTLNDEGEWDGDLTRFPFNADWEITVLAANTTSPVPPFQVNSMGIILDSPLDDDDHVYHELYNSALGGPARIGSSTVLNVNNTSQGGADSSTLAVNSVVLRMSWNSATKVLTCSYDTDPTNAPQWIELASFGLSSAGGGATANADWGLAATDRFFLSVYGFSSFMSVSSGQMYLDNFAESGGVAGGSGTRPQPVGSFSFPFPLGNDLLTRIADITGNYQGITPGQRAYNIDAAQDESGKILAMGTTDGITDATGDPDITANVGSVRTVNGEPVAQLKGSFKGVADGMNVSYRGSGAFPVELVDVGGEDGVMGSATYAMKLGGVPFSGKNVPVDMAAPPGAENNLKQDWTLDLDLATKTIKGKERIVASAELVLPSGDHVQFGERVVKYSEKKGYKLAFKKGTNTSANPDRLDKKATIILTGLKFEKNGDAWEPVEGMINYRFNGQKGLEDLMEFVPP